MELEFGKYLSENNISIWIRQVIIPGITDNEEDLLLLKKYLSLLKTVEKIELISYHTLGKYKWEQLGYAYELKDIPSATPEDIARAKTILEC